MRRKDDLDLIIEKLTEWGRIKKATAIKRLTPLMDPDHAVAWYAPQIGTTPAVKLAQEAVVRRKLRQLLQRRKNPLIEHADGTIEWGAPNYAVRHRESPGHKDRYCELCGFGPRVRLHAHVAKDHADIGGVAGYKRQFGPQSLTSGSYSRHRGEVLKDMIEDGIEFGRQRQTTCPNGHRLAGRNVMRRTVTIKGKQYEVRNCRKCWYEWHNEHRREKRAAKPKLPKRRCDNNGRHWFQPKRKDQRFCSPECKAAWHNAQRRAS